MYEDVTGASQGDESPDEASAAAEGHGASPDRHSPVADGHTAGASAGGGGADEVSGGLSGGAADLEAGEPVGWQRLGRARSAPVGMGVHDSAGPVLSEFSEAVAVNKLWRQGHAHLGGVTPVLRRSQEVPALPDEYMAAMGWQEVQAPKADDDDEVIRAFLGPAPTQAEADALARDFGWDEPQGEAYDPLISVGQDVRPVFGPAGGAELLAHAAPDPRGRPWPLGPSEQRLPVGVAPGPDGQVVDVGAIARQRIDGPAVVALENVQVEHTDAYTVVEAIAAWDRIEAWAGYQKRMLARELASRSQLGAHGRVSTEARVPVATAEIAFRLGVTRQGARRLIDAGAAMTVGAGMIAGDALREGEIDAAKADMVIERTAHLPADLALGVQDEVLRGDGAMRTLPQLRRAVDGAVARVDPEESNAAHARARRKRCVGAPQKLPHGMASTRIVWSAADAMALHAALEAAARTAKSDADGRTLDQLRTDALAAMAHTAMTTGHIGLCPTCVSTDSAATTTVADCGTARGDRGSQNFQDDSTPQQGESSPGEQDGSGGQDRQQDQGGSGGQDRQEDQDARDHQENHDGHGAAFGITGAGGAGETGCNCPPAPTDAEPNSDGPAEPDTGSPAESETGGHAGSDADGHAEPGTGGSAESETGGHAGPDADGHAEPGTGGSAESETGGHAGPGADGHAEPGTGDSTESETDGSAERGTGSPAKPGADGHAESETGGSAEPASKVCPEPPANAGAEPAKDARPAAASDADCETEANPTTDTAPESATGRAEPEAKASAETEAEAGQEAETDAGSGASADADAGFPGPDDTEQNHPEPDRTEPDRTEPDRTETDPDHAESGGAGKKPTGHVCSGPEQCGPVAPELFVLGTVGGAKAQIRITVPLSTLMGSSDEPGDLEGYGPVPADVARAHAAGGTWRRLVTDPLTDRTLEVTAKEYKPPGWLREQVIADAPYCVAPGCGVQARHTDLDHGRPFPDGPTAAWNLHPVCRHHHRLKTQGHLCYHSPAEGVYEWTTPTGHRYRAEANGTYLLEPAGTSTVDPPPF